MTSVWPLEVTSWWKDKITPTRCPLTTHSTPIHRVNAIETRRGKNKKLEGNRPIGRLQEPLWMTVVIHDTWGQRTALVWVPTFHLALDRVFVPQLCWRWPSSCGLACLRLCHSRTALPITWFYYMGSWGFMLAHHILHPAGHLLRISPGTFSFSIFLHSVESLEFLGRDWRYISVVEHLLTCTSGLRVRPSNSYTHEAWNFDMQWKQANKRKKWFLVTCWSSVPWLPLKFTHANLSGNSPANPVLSCPSAGIWGGGEVWKLWWSCEPGDSVWGWTLVGQLEASGVWVWTCWHLWVHVCVCVRVGICGYMCVRVAFVSTCVYVGEKKMTFSSTS